jgi:hypothetical protein
VDVSSSTAVSTDAGSGLSRVRVIRQDDLAEGGASGGETRFDTIKYRTALNKKFLNRGQFYDSKRLFLNKIIIVISASCCSLTRVYIYVVYTR